MGVTINFAYGSLGWLLESRERPHVGRCPARC
jgi:hypothetical protein